MKQLLAIFGVVLLVATTGCLGLATYKAPQASVTEEGLNNTGYELDKEEDIVFNRTEGAFGVEKEFRVTSKLTVYEKQNNNTNGITVPPSVYGILSTPSVEFFGTQVNPIIIDPSQRALDGARNQTVENVTIGEQADSINVTHTSGQNITVKEYNGTIELKQVSASYDAKVFTTVIETDDAVMVPFLVYPAAADNVENEGSGNMTEREIALQLIKNTTA